MAASVQKISHACRLGSFIWSLLSTIAPRIIGGCIVFSRSFYDHASLYSRSISGIVLILGHLCFDYSRLVFNCHLLFTQLRDNAEATHLKEYKDGLLVYETGVFWVDYLQYLCIELSMLSILLVQVKYCSKEFFRVLSI